MNPDFQDVLIFDAGGRRHAIAAASVRELLPALTVMPLPGAPTDVEGVINLRGEIVPVRRLSGLPAKIISLTDHFIVIRHGDRLTALHVDHALELVRLESAAIVDVEIESEHKPRVVKLGDGMVFLHRVEDLIADWETVP